MSNKFINNYLLMWKEPGFTPYYILENRAIGRNKNKCMIGLF